MTSHINSDILAAGAFAAFTVDFLVYPLDTIKTRVQSPSYASLYKDRATGKVNLGALFRGPYQGIASVVVATIPSSGAFFTTYEGTKYVLSTLSTTGGDTPHGSGGIIPIPTPINHSLASGLAELVSCAILTPAEVIKQNAQAIKPAPTTSATNKLHISSSSTLKVLSGLYRRPATLWSGYTALAARNLPSTAVQFPLYEALKAKMTSWQRERDVANNRKVETDGSKLLRHASTTAFSAGIAGSIAATVTTPIDVLKTRIMLGVSDDRPARQGLKQRAAGAKRHSTSLWSVGHEVYNQEGLRGLFRGGVLRAGWTALGLGLYLGSYEAGRMFLENRRNNQGAYS